MMLTCLRRGSILLAARLGRPPSSLLLALAPFCCYCATTINTSCTTIINNNNKINNMSSDSSESSWLDLYSRINSNINVSSIICSSSNSSSSSNGSGACRRLSTSSAAWLKRHSSDQFATQAREQNLRSRAYFKLKEIQDKHRLITNSSLVVDLGSSPGGWSLLAADIVYQHQQQQIVNKKDSNSKKYDVSGVGMIASNTATLSHSSSSVIAPSATSSTHHQVQSSSSIINNPNINNKNNSNNINSLTSVRICSIDLLPMDPISGVRFIQGSFLDEVNQRKIVESFGGSKATVVLSDMLHNTSGSKELDHMKSMDLCTQALEFCENNVEVGGTFLCKYLNGKDEMELVDQASSLFASVARIKPKASRGESSEMYLLCKNRRK